MKIDIHNIPSEGLTLDFKRKAQDFTGLKELMDNGECGFAAPLSISMEIFPVHGFIQIKGRLETVFTLTCARCLEPFKQSQKGDFILNYSREIPKDLHKGDSEGIELTAEQIGMIYFDGEEIDFTDAIQEQVILAMPFKPLCKQDCKGLCITCGQNLNTGICSCVDNQSGGAFEVLKNLKLPIGSKK